jgi:hypothetical protein
MIQLLRKAASKFKQTTKDASLIKEVPLKDCVHFCGFKYGGQQYHPYETYITGLKEGMNSKVLKDQFISFLRYYQPDSLNDALGISMKKKYPIWKYPWDRHENYDFPDFINLDPDDVIDILTHHSKKGILSYKIDQEFYWMERALKSITKQGYVPRKYSYLSALMFEDNRGECRYLLLDGNHRISAAYALGWNVIEIQVSPENIIREKDVTNWPSVKNGFFSAEDALLIFRKYFDGNLNYTTANIPAKILNYSNNYGSIYNT